MKKYLAICVLSFGIGLLWISVMASAKQTTMSTYYTSPSGTYTKIHLMNGAGGPDENAGAFCATLSNAGTIFVDKTSGYLEICKPDGTVASFGSTTTSGISYAAACFNRFCSGAGCTAPCPSPYYPTTTNTFTPSIGLSITSISCCQSNTSPASSTFAKSGCFSTFCTGVGCSTSSSCTNGPNPDFNVHNIGVDTFAINGTTTITKATCCFNTSTP